MTKAPAAGFGAPGPRFYSADGHGSEMAPMRKTGEPIEAVMVMMVMAAVPVEVESARAEAGIVVPPEIVAEMAVAMGEAGPEVPFEGVDAARGAVAGPIRPRRLCREPAEGHDQGQGGDQPKGTHRIDSVVHQAHCPTAGMPVLASAGIGRLPPTLLSANWGVAASSAPGPMIIPLRKIRRHPAPIAIRAQPLV